VKPRLLVLTTVHHPDDPRIRERLIRTLAPDFDVTYAARTPGPSDRDGLTWLPLNGGRLRRNAAAARHLWFSRYDVASLQDPELLPTAIMVRLIRRKRIVFDLHENLPAQAATKPWLWRPLRPPVAWLSRRLLRIAERVLAITLAEQGYADLFRREHPVFPNHPDTERLPAVTADRDGSVVYVGDITEARGLREAVVAAGAAGIPVRLIGSVSDDERRVLETLAREHDALVRFDGRMPHLAAMESVGKASVAISPLRDLPNYRHSLPTKILEYLAMGVPVVATDLPGTREVVEGLESVWLVPAGDAVALATALSEASEADETAAPRQATAVRERFRWPTDRVAEFYRRLVG
jgi:glycosyltransferase involved in cell wall biosynthesis